MSSQYADDLDWSFAVVSQDRDDDHRIKTLTISSFGNQFNGNQVSLHDPP